MGAYENHRNNSMPFVNGGISASMKSGQPQKGLAHGAVYGIRLYNIYRPYGGVLEALRKVFLRFAYAPIPKRNIFMRIAIKLYCKREAKYKIKTEKHFWGCTDFMDADMPPLTKDRSLFLRFAYAPIPKQFERDPIGTLF